MVDEQTFNRVAEEFHHSIANSEMDSIGVLLAFAQAWVGCNLERLTQRSSSRVRRRI
jgi:hypothetical protein